MDGVGAGEERVERASSVFERAKDGERKRRRAKMRSVALRTSLRALTPPACAHLLDGAALASLAEAGAGRGVVREKG